MLPPDKLILNCFFIRIENYAKMVIRRIYSLLHTETFCLVVILPNNIFLKMTKLYLFTDTDLIFKNDIENR